MVKTRFANLETFDFLGSDNTKPVSQILPPLAGITPTSNMNKIDVLLESHNTEIAGLKNKPGILTVDLIYDSTTDGTDFFKADGITSVVSYVDKMLILFYLSRNNSGKVSININQLGWRTIKKNIDGINFVDFVANDLKGKVGYLFQYDIMSNYFKITNPSQLVMIDWRL